MENSTENHQQVIVTFEGTRSQFEQIQALFESGDLSELLGVSVVTMGALPQESAPQEQPANWITQLSQWVQSSFVSDWQPCVQLLGQSLLPAYRGSSPESVMASWQQALDQGQAIARTKLLKIGEYTLHLLVAFQPDAIESNQMNILIQIESVESSYLPEGLRISVLDDQKQAVRNSTGQPLEAISPSEVKCLQLDLFGCSGESFLVSLELGTEQVIGAFLI